MTGSGYIPRWRSAHAAGHAIGAMAVGVPVEVVRVGAEHEAPVLPAISRPGYRERQALVLLAGPAAQRQATGSTWGTTEATGCLTDFAAARAVIGPILSQLVPLAGDLARDHFAAVTALAQALEDAGGELAPEAAVAIVHRVDPGLPGCLSDVREAIDRRARQLTQSTPPRRRGRHNPRRAPGGALA